MTIQTGESSPHSHAQFHQFLSEHGVDQIDGLEIVRLVKMVANTYESVITTQMGGEQLTGPRWRLLLRLLMEEEQGRPEVNPTHLSRTQQVSKNTISSHLRALEEQGLIERTLDPGDRRQFRIQIQAALIVRVKHSAILQVQGRQLADSSCLVTHPLCPHR